MAHTRLEFGTLPLSDGSATYTAYGCSIVASVNGPVEVTRRDELPEAATIDVSVRPAAGIGGIRERHFETILHRILRHVIRVGDLPRTLLQVTLQITTGIDQDTTSGRPNQMDSNLYMLPLLLNASTLALISTAIPLETTPIATIVAIAADGSLTQSPSWHHIQQAASIHAFAFSTGGQLLMAESEGSFEVETWEKAVHVAKQASVGQVPTPDEDDMVEDHKATLETLIRSSVQDKIQQDKAWITS